MKKSELAAVAKEASSCTKCRLCYGRTNAVPGEGLANARILLIGEAPGRNEDKTGRPFVGQAGRLLERALSSAGLRREEVFITSVVKCRPPGNRTPKPDEIEACRSYLDRQVDALSPSIIVALGRVAVKEVAGSKGNLVRGQAGVFRGVSVYSTYHPAAALHGRPELFKALVEDLVTVARQVRPQSL